METYNIKDRDLILQSVYDSRNPESKEEDSLKQPTEGCHPEETLRDSVSRRKVVPSVSH